MEEDYYKILEVDKKASPNDIKRSFQKLIKKCHPDKLPAELSGSEREVAIKRFHKITEAHDTLSDEEKRIYYDRKHNAESLTQKWPISEILDLDDMSFNPSEGCYASPCRCGGCYEVTEEELEEGVEVVCCSSCSLSIQVLYRYRESH